MFVNDNKIGNIDTFCRKSRLDYKEKEEYNEEKTKEWIAMRKNYLDNIRWCTIILVVFFHVFFFFNNIGTTAIYFALQTKTVKEFLKGRWQNP